jgi:molybdate transport system substrate-binding protein
MTSDRSRVRALYQISLVVLLLLVALSLVTGCGRKTKAQPLIFAAASLADLLTDAAQVYEQQTGTAVLFSFGGSNTLANQIVTLNAPADGVIMAGQTPMQRLTDVGKVASSNVAIVAQNTLVVVSSDAEVLSALTELSNQSGRIAIADPDLAPAGQYARDALRSAGIWDELHSRIVPTLDVRAALAAVNSGSVEYAIVYATDAMTETDLKIVLQVDQQLYSTVQYPAAPITGAQHADAAVSFIEFLQSPEATVIFQRYGFSTP